MNPTPFAIFVTALVFVVGTGGCKPLPPRGDRIVPPEVPVELKKITHPEYVVEAPDILQITAIQAVPRQPYKIQAFDALSVFVIGTPKESPISGIFVVEPDGTLNLGPTYKTVRVADLTAEEAQKAVEAYLSSQAVGLTKPIVSVSIAQTRGVQQISGEHLVRADGTVYLGTYGNVRIAGLTLTQARKKIEEHLVDYLYMPQITLDVLAYNSKVYYVIFDGAGAGQQITRLPVTGNETVLDAISRVGGLGTLADQQHIWLARPAPPQGGCDQILPVDWFGITTKGQTATNYQILPGDRLFVKAYRATALDITLARVIAPVERIFGIILLGNSTIQQFKSSGSGNTTP